jgi:hypothetical protein
MKSANLTISFEKFGFKQFLFNTKASFRPDLVHLELSFTPRSFHTSENALILVSVKLHFKATNLVA